MEKLLEKGKNQKPGIILDKKRGIFDFSGVLAPENAKEFYAPILKCIDQYLINPNKETIAIFRMDYCNTDSSKPLFEILSKFNKLYELGKDVIIEWHYSDDNKIMEELGEEYADLLSVPFLFKSFV